MELGQARRSQQVAARAVHRAVMARARALEWHAQHGPQRVGQRHAMAAERLVHADLRRRHQVVRRRRAQCRREAAGDLRRCLQVRAHGVLCPGGCQQGCGAGWKEGARSAAHACHTIAAVGFVRGIKHIGAHRKAALPSTAWLSGAAGAGRIAIGTALTRRHRPSKCSCTGRRSEDQHSIMSTSSSMDRDFECCSGKAAGLRRTPVADSTYSNGGERWRCAAGAHCPPAVADCTALLHCIQPST